MSNNTLCFESPHNSGLLIAFDVVSGSFKARIISFKDDTASLELLNHLHFYNIIVLPLFSPFDVFKISQIKIRKERPPRKIYVQPKKLSIQQE